MSRIVQCATALRDQAPEFDRNIKLDSIRLQVTYRGETFGINRFEYLLLQLLIEAPNETRSMDELITAIWGTKEPAWPEDVVKQRASKLRAKFRLIEPNFDMLRAKTGYGYYWRREQHALDTKGRVSVAKHIHEGYADDQPINLTPTEYTIVRALVLRDLVTYQSVDVQDQLIFNVYASRLNHKFKPILKTRLVTSDTYGLGAIRLNKSLLTKLP